MDRKKIQRKAKKKREEEAWSDRMAVHCVFKKEKTKKRLASGTNENECRNKRRRSKKKSSKN